MSTSEGRFDAALEKILTAVEKPGRYSGGEWNAVRKDPARVLARIALAFPDVYEIGMSYLGQKILYSLINSHPAYAAERVFAPWPDFERELRRSHVSLYSLESKTPLREFDILGFSLLYELNYSNILTILDLAGIPFRAENRNRDYPLVIAGGPAAFNPEPVADFFDLFLIGDGEEAFLEIIDAYAALKKQRRDKEDILRELSRISGVYVPRFYQAYRPNGSLLLAVRPSQGVAPAIEKRVLRAFARSHSPEDIVVPAVQAVFDRVAVEVSRGCPQKCRFCQATSVYAPHRVKDPAFVIEKVTHSLRATGYEDVSLFSLSVGDYPYLDETVRALMRYLEKRRISLSLSSLRPKGLSAEVAGSITRVRKTGFTLVPETGSERLRRVINKSWTDEELRVAASNAFRAGWRLLKLYFMIGLPTETENDVEGIAGLVDQLESLGRRIRGSSPRIRVSISSFIPKPHTPFQWLAMLDERTLRERQDRLRDLYRKRRLVELKFHPVKGSILEAVFSRGDRRLAGVLEAAWTKGARFDSWRDFFQFSLWEKAFRDAGVDSRDYLNRLDPDAVLPWDHIRTGIRKSFLLEELERALSEETSPSCLETSCGRCRGCDFSADLERKFATKLDVAAAEDMTPAPEKKTNFRYRASYAKQGLARFLGHGDLINALQRSFRRAGVTVAHSEGFHPKMLMSFVPALPLGMKSCDEWLEFLSPEEFNEEEILCRVNSNVPDGIHFKRLKKIGEAAPSLNEAIQSMVYSLDIGSEDFQEALAILRRTRILSDDPFEATDLIIQDYGRHKLELLEEISVDRADRKLWLRIRHAPEKVLRPQDVIRDIFGLERAVYIMTREKIVFPD
jgi:radical SAM family uncharacterized protein/radical SAM-linked protein